MKRTANSKYVFFSLELISVKRENVTRAHSGRMSAKLRKMNTKTSARPKTKLKLNFQTIQYEVLTMTQTKTMETIPGLLAAPPCEDHNMKQTMAGDEALKFCHCEACGLLAINC